MCDCISVAPSNWCVAPSNLACLLCEALQEVVGIGEQDRHAGAGLRPDLVLGCSTLEKWSRREEDFTLG